jgi:hypothetical protein
MRESDETEIAMVENSHQQCGTEIKVSTVEVQEDHICDCLHALEAFCAVAVIEIVSPGP